MFKSVLAGVSLFFVTACGVSSQANLSHHSAGVSEAALDDNVVLSCVSVLASPLVTIEIRGFDGNSPFGVGGSGVATVRTVSGGVETTERFKIASHSAKRSALNLRSQEKRAFELISGSPIKSLFDAVLDLRNGRVIDVMCH